MLLTFLSVDNYWRRWWCCGFAHLIIIFFFSHHRLRQNVLIIGFVVASISNHKVYLEIRRKKSRIWGTPSREIFIPPPFLGMDNKRIYLQVKQKKERIRILNSTSGLIRIIFLSLLSDILKFFAVFSSECLKLSTDILAMAMHEYPFASFTRWNCGLYKLCNTFCHSWSFYPQHWFLLKIPILKFLVQIQYYNMSLELSKDNFFLVKKILVDNSFNWAHKKVHV